LYEASYLVRRRLRLRHMSPYISLYLPTSPYISRLVVDEVRVEDLE